MQLDVCELPVKQSLGMTSGLPYLVIVNTKRVWPDAGYCPQAELSATSSPCAAHLLLAVVLAEVDEVVDICMPGLQVQRKCTLALATPLVHIPGHTPMCEPLENCIWARCT